MVVIFILLFFIFILFYFFKFFGCITSSLQCTGFSLVVVCGFSLSSCATQAPERMGSSLQHVGSLVEACELSSCGVWV